MSTSVLGSNLRHSGDPSRTILLANETSSAALCALRRERNGIILLYLNFIQSLRFTANYLYLFVHSRHVHTVVRKLPRPHWCSREAHVPMHQLLLVHQPLIMLCVTDYITSLCNSFNFQIIAGCTFQDSCIHDDLLKFWIKRGKEIPQIRLLQTVQKVNQHPFHWEN